MKNQPQTHRDGNSRKHADILTKLRSAFVHYFEQLVDDCCMRIDLEFGLQLARDREKAGKEQHKKMLEYLRQMRKDLKRSYLLKVEEGFDNNSRKMAQNPSDDINLSGVSLAKDELVEEEYAVAMIIRNCEHRFHEELHRFNKQLALQMGLPAVSDRHNPIAPERLVHALVAVVAPLKLNTGFRITLYKTFDANVFSHLGFIYRELSQQFESERLAQQTEFDAVSKAAEPDAAVAEPSNTAFRQLQQKLALWRAVQAPSPYDRIPHAGNVSYEHFEVKHALEILQQGYGKTQGGEQNKPLKWQVIKQLEALDFSDELKCLSEPDEDVLDLVSLLFTEIQQEAALSESVKSALLQLQIPLAAACLRQYSFFINKDNPIRQLIDNLFAAGLFLNGDDYGDRLVYERVVDIIRRIVKEQGSSLAFWITESGEFSHYLEKHMQRSRIIEERSLQVMQNKEALALSKKAVAETIDGCLRGKELPAAIVDFLRKVWQDVLLVDYVRKAEEPELWQASVRAMEELIISVLPPADESERKQILKFLPGLIQELRNGLKRISYDKNAQSRFFKDLAVWHIILMDKKEKKPESSAETGRITTADDSEEINAALMPECTDPQLANLAEDSWVAFDLESGRQWGKLVWQSSATGMLHFVGKNGVKTIEISAAELAEKFRGRQAARVELNEKTITERVLSNLMSL